MIVSNQQLATRGDPIAPAESLHPVTEGDPARIGPAEARILQVSGSVFRTLSQTVGYTSFLQIATSRWELFTAFRLVYQEYRKAGLVHPNPLEVRLTPYHLLPTTDVIVAATPAGKEAACTVTLVRDGRMGLPIESIFPETVIERRRQGRSIAEVTSLADNREVVGSGTSLVFQVMSFMAQRAKLKGVDDLLITVHPHHAKFYERFIGFKVIGDSRPYGSVLDNPAVPLALDLNRLKFDHPRAYERFFGTPFPVEMLSGHSVSAAIRSELRRIALACETITATQV